MINFKNISVTQGRLVPISKDKKFKNKIQQFPDELWRKELTIFYKNNIKFIEWVISIENFNLNPITKKNMLKIIKDLLRKNNVNIRSIDLDFLVYSKFFNKKFTIKIKNKIDLIIKNAIKLDVKYIIFPFLEKQSLINNERKKKVITYLNSLLQKYEKKINFLIEIDLKPKDVLAYIKKFNGKIGITYDTGNSAGLGFKFNEEKKYFKFVRNIHLKDKIKNGKSVRLGKGNYNFKNLFKFLKKTNYRYGLNLQTARSKNGNDLSEILLNMKYLKKLIT